MFAFVIAVVEVESASLLAVFADLPKKLEVFDCIIVVAKKTLEKPALV